MKSHGQYQALVDYVPTGGTAQVFKPDVTDQQALTNTLAGLFSGVKSCTFDLNSIDPAKPTIKVNTSALEGGSGDGFSSGPRSYRSTTPTAGK